MHDLDPLISQALLKQGVAFPSDLPTPPTFACPVCRSPYDTVEKMLQCLNQPVERGRFKVGDIVMAGGKYMHGGHVKAPHWIAMNLPAQPGHVDHFRHTPQAHMWFVITNIRHEEHREIASLVTLARGALSGGWNPTVEPTHHSLWKPGEPMANWFDGSTKYWDEAFAGHVVVPPSPQMLEEAAYLASKNLAMKYLL